MTIKVAVVGARGYTGRELIRIFLRHPSIEITALTGTLEEPEPVSGVFPELRHIHDINVVPIDTEAISREADAVFLGLPHKVAQEYAGKFIRAGKHVFDLSADFRFTDISLYEKTYGIKHQEKELARKSVYGLAEIYRAAIKTTQLIGVPGCYPTGALLGILPWGIQGAPVSSPIIIDAKSGVSGAGKKPSERTHFPECNESISAYNVGSHRHQPEIQEKVLELGADKTSNIDVIFTPHLVPMNRGILTTLYIQLSENIAEDEIDSIYHKQYAGETFIRLLPRGSFPATADVAYTNFCDIGWKQVHPRLVVVVTAIDNLLKGASGQAVQCFNMCYGFPEETGLL